MTTEHTSNPAAARIDLSRRDLTLDLARVFCVLVVVAIHLLFVGVGAGPDGGLLVSRPLEELDWFAGATWVGQIMPLFFVVGGFAAYTSLRNARDREPDHGLLARTFAHTRIQRLARPALPLFVVLALVLGGATLAGVDPGLLRAVAVGIGSPLWFLCAYLICQLVAPRMLQLHDRAPRATLVVLLAAVVIVDLVRGAWVDGPTDFSGAGLVGYLNLLFVWPLIQQLGFWYADGWFARRRWWQLVLIAAVSWASLVPMVMWGPYSVDMLSNLNPPTLPLVALGVGQAALLQLLRTPLTALMRTRAAQAVVFAIGSRLMTVYLWHLPVIVAVAGVGLLIPGGSPEPGGATWWLLRPLLFLVVLGVVFALSLPLARFERPVPAPHPAGLVALGIAGAATTVPTFVITVSGLDAWSATAAAVGFAIAVLVLRGGQNPTSPNPTSPKSPNSAAASSAADAS